MTVQAVVFDLDGTLLDTLKSLANCYNRVLSANQLDAHDIDAYRYFIGNGARRCLTACLSTSGDLDQLSAEQVDQLLEQQQTDYRSNWALDVEIYPGILELCRSLKARDIPMGVLTNKDQEFAEQCVQHFFPDGYFSFVQGFSESVPHKPNPTGAKIIANSLGVESESIVLLGDTAVDIETAVAAGFVGVGALWGFRDAAELEQAGADHIIATPVELLNLLD